MMGLVFGFSLHGMQPIGRLLSSNSNDTSIYGWDRYHHELMRIVHAPLVNFNATMFDQLMRGSIDANYKVTDPKSCNKGFMLNATLLGVACSNANYYAIRSLLAKGANPNLKTAKYILPILAVMKSGAEINIQVDCLNLLREYKADFRSPVGDFHNQDTPLHVAARQCPHIVPYLLMSHDVVSVDCPGNYGKTPLMCALEGFGGGYTENAVKALIEYKASLSVLDQFGQSVRFFAEKYDWHCSEFNKECFQSGESPIDTINMERFLFPESWQKQNQF